MEDHKEKKQKPFRLPIIFTSIIAIVIVISASAFSIFGLAKKPVLFRDGNVIQIVDSRTPIEIEKIKEVKIFEATKRDTEKEIQKIAYCIQSLQPRQSYESAMLIARATYKECTEKSVSIPLWIALMFAESSLDPMKASNMGAIGLCQVRYSVWKEQPELMDNGVQIKDKLFWVDLNIKCATTIFKKYYDESGRKIGNTLWRYNSGQTKLPETKKAYDIDYVSKIMYYTYKVAEILTEEDSKMHPINDMEAQADTVNTLISTVPDKAVKKPVIKRD